MSTSCKRRLISSFDSRIRANSLPFRYNVGDLTRGLRRSKLARVLDHFDAGFASGFGNVRWRRHLECNDEHDRSSHSRHAESASPGAPPRLYGRAQRRPVLPRQQPAGMLEGFSREDGWRRLAGETGRALSAYREGLACRTSRFGCGVREVTPRGARWRSPSARCARWACAASLSIAIAAITLPWMPTVGLTMQGSPISSRGSSVRDAEAAGPMSGPISSGVIRGLPSGGTEARHEQRLGAAFCRANQGQSPQGALTHRENSAILAAWLLSTRSQMPSGTRPNSRIECD